MTQKSFSHIIYGFGEALEGSPSAKTKFIEDNARDNYWLLTDNRNE